MNPANASSLLPVAGRLNWIVAIALFATALNGLRARQASVVS